MGEIFGQKSRTDFWLKISFLIVSRYKVLAVSCIFV